MREAASIFMPSNFCLFHKNTKKKQKKFQTLFLFKLLNIVYVLRFMLRWTNTTSVFIEHFMFSFVWTHNAGNQTTQSTLKKLLCFFLDFLQKKRNIIIIFSFTGKIFCNHLKFTLEIHFHNCFFFLSHKSTIKVFRCQLPRENKYYKPTPPNEDDPQVNFDWRQSIFVFRTVQIN